MKSIRLHPDEIRCACQGYALDVTPEAMGRVYDAAVEAWTAAGFPPNRLGASAPEVRGIGNRWGTFKFKHKRLEKTGFVGVDYFSLVHLEQPEGGYPKDVYVCEEGNATLQATLAYRYFGLGFRWIPSIVGAQSGAMLELFHRALDAVNAQYAYRRHAYSDYRRAELLGPAWGPQTDEQRELNASRSYWHHERRQCLAWRMLPGLYPHNYLNDDILDAPLGKSRQSLRAWIEAHPPTRGSLRPVTRALTEWAPPPEHLPEIREMLFRKGRIFSSRFVTASRVLWKPGERERHGWRRYAPEPFYRPIMSDPWEATGKIPMAYRAEYFRTLDPMLRLG